MAIHQPHIHASAWLNTDHGGSRVPASHKKPFGNLIGIVNKSLRKWYHESTSFFLLSAPESLGCFATCNHIHTIPCCLLRPTSLAFCEQTSHHCVFFLFLYLSFYSSYSSPLPRCKWSSCAERSFLWSLNCFHKYSSPLVILSALLFALDGSLSYCNCLPWMFFFDVLIRAGWLEEEERVESMPCSLMYATADSLGAAAPLWVSDGSFGGRSEEECLISHHRLPQWQLLLSCNVTAERKTCRRPQQGCSCARTEPQWRRRLCSMAMGTDSC